MRSSDAWDRRILYLVTSDISARFLRGQLAYLIGHGYEVSVGSRLSDPPAPFDDGVAIYDVDFVREPNVLADLKGLVATGRLIRRVRPTIVNASTPKAGLLGMIAAWMCRVPKRVYVVRGLRFETTSGPRRQVLRWLERAATAAATDVVYNSRSLMAVAEDARTVGVGRGVVLGGGSGNGIDVTRFADLPTKPEARASLGLDDDARVIGFVGRLTRDKGIIDLVEAFESSTDVSILLVGDFEPGDPVPEAIRDRIEALPHFVHIPWVDDTRTVYPAMDVLAFPSYREGLPNVPLEAQLCGVPVVAYAATGTVDAVAGGPRGALVDVADYPALRERALDILEHPTRSEGLGQAAAEWVRAQFDQARLWARLASVYNADDRS